MKNLFARLALAAALGSLLLTTQAVLAQTTAFTYQGRVTANGTNFTGAGQFKFALVTSLINSGRQATAFSFINGQHQVINLHLVDGGIGYSSPPTVTIFGGGGSGATATAILGGGGFANFVGSLTLNSQGFGYTNPPTVTISPPTASTNYITYWSNDGTSTSGSEPAAAVSVAVTDGLFTVLLGDPTLPNMTAISTSVFTQTNLQLQIWFNDGVNGSAMLSPVQNLTPTPYAVMANNANNLLGSISAAQIYDGFPASQISGTLVLAQLPAAVVTNNETGVTLNGTFSGSGAGLTNLPGGSGGTSVNNPNTIVSRDAGGSFAAGNITNNNLYLPATTPATGIIYAGNLTLMHDYGAGNFFAGPAAGNLFLSGNDNTGLGYQALYNITSGSYNTANGYLALYANTNGTYNTADGMLSLYNNTRGYENTAVGYLALYDNTIGYENTAIGVMALALNTTGINNTASGYQAVYNNRSGSYNTANGFQALYSNTSGSNNTANGYQALFNNLSGYENTADGVQALYNNMTGYDNTASGHQALYNNSIGIENTAMGDQALYNNTSGDWNTAIGGESALGNNTSGFGNTAIGDGALANNTSGSGNTALGIVALHNNTSGNNNIALGVSAGVLLTTGSSNIDIGHIGFAGEANTIRLGEQGTQTNTFIAGIYGATVASGVPVYVNSSGQLGNLTSSRQFKDDIRSMDDASRVLLALHPVTFHYKPGIDPHGIPQFGLVAEEVEKVCPDLVARDAEGQIYTVRYEAVNAMLLNEFLKQHQKVEEQNSKVEEQNAEIQHLKQSVAELKKMVQSLTEKK